MAKVYRKPFAALFTDEPPEPLEELPDLRRLFHILKEEGADLVDIPPDVTDAVGEALARRDLYLELAIDPVRFELEIDPARSLDVAAEILRKGLGVSWEEQTSCRTGNKSRRLWSSLLESVGILVFQFTAPLEQARGFSVSHRETPIVAANSGDSEFGRVFSLLHELVHVCLPNEHSLSSEKCEQFCNGVAGRILVPRRKLREVLSRRGARGSLRYESLSREFGVSQEVVARRLLDTGVISDDEYEDIRLTRQRIPPPKRSGGGNYYSNRKAQLGRVYVAAVFEALSDRRITLAGAGRAFEMNPLNVSKFRAHVMKGA